MPRQSQANLILHLKGILNSIEIHQPQYIEAGSVKEFLTNYKLWKTRWFWKSSKMS